MEKHNIIGTSVKLDLITNALLCEIAAKCFQGNKSAAIASLIQHTKPKEFYRMKARYHAQQLQHYKQLVDNMEYFEKEKAEQQELSAEVTV